MSCILETVKKAGKSKTYANQGYSYIFYKSIIGSNIFLILHELPHALTLSRQQCHALWPSVSKCPLHFLLLQIMPYSYWLSAHQHSTNGLGVHAVYVNLKPFHRQTFQSNRASWSYYFHLWNSTVAPSGSMPNRDFSAR